jgi:endonuclease-3
VQAKNILLVCQILLDKYDGDIPGTFDELLELPGVGPKMVRLGDTMLLHRHGVMPCWEPGFGRVGS